MNTWIELDSKALIHNYITLKSLAKNSIFCPVIKSEAYGHGIKEVYNILKSQNPDWLAVNYISEATRLRQLGYTKRILIVGPIFSTDFDKGHAYQLDLVLGSKELLESFHKLPKDQKPRIHIKIDSGMSRQGLYLEDLVALKDILVENKIHIEGVCTHFANVEDVTEYSYAQKQYDYFQKAKKYLRTLDISPITHLASSASNLIMPESRESLVRVGIALYGFWPSTSTKISFAKISDTPIELKPVLSWLTKVAAVKTVKKGQYIGYGCTVRANMDLTIAVLPVGYFEGYQRLISGSSHAYVLLKGTRCSILGRICMNMMMIDISHIKEEVTLEEVVTLIGKDKDEVLLAGEVAEWCQTIHYELVTRINPQIERRLI